ncbi:MAG: hypothetical protein O2816_03685, partial [Planctomycetota bacterium]|nr:hypothetical protein [Planctomycetota bacterium]
MKNLLLVSLVLLTPAAAQDSQARSDSSSSSHTKRVVVVNGKTVVDEETRDGKPVRGSQRGAAPVDLDRLLKDLEQDLGKGKTSSSSSSSSHSKRVVVINGKTVVDEEIKDGEPVRGSKKGAAPVDLDRLLKDLEQDLGKGKT